MSENSLHSSLLEIFSRSNKEIWKQSASQEIEGKDPFEFLSWKSRDEIIFFPYYESSDVNQHSYLKKFPLTVGEDSFSGPRRWLNVPRVFANDVSQANKVSLSHLANGADGIFFQLDASAGLHSLLSNIAWPYCSLFFKTNTNNFKTESLADYIIQNNLELKKLTGALFWESVPKKSEIDYFLHNSNFKSCGIIIQPSSPIIEIAEAITKGVQAVEALRSNDEVSSEVFNSIAFSISVDSSFFESIAKLKALRLLWYQVSQAYGRKEFHPSDLHIHVEAPPFINAVFDPHGNLIKSTTAAMSSIIGGCNSLTIIPAEENTTLNRIARNVSSVLREESHFDKVADPLQGTYAVDIMVHEFAQKAWTLFQSKTNA